MAKVLTGFTVTASRKEALAQNIASKLELADGPILFKVFHKKSVDRERTFERHFIQRNRYLSKMRNSYKVANGVDLPLAMRFFDAFAVSQHEPLLTFSTVGA